MLVLSGLTILIGCCLGIDGPALALFAFLAAIPACLVFVPRTTCVDCQIEFGDELDHLQ